MEVEGGEGNFVMQKWIEKVDRDRSVIKWREKTVKK